MYGDPDPLLDLIDLSADGILLTDEEGMIFIWNQGMERMAGLSKAQAQGIPLGAIKGIVQSRFRIMA